MAELSKTKNNNYENLENYWQISKCADRYCNFSPFYWISSIFECKKQFFCTWAKSYECRPNRDSCIVNFVMEFQRGSINIIKAH